MAYVCTDAYDLVGCSWPRIFVDSVHVEVISRGDVNVYLFHFDPQIRLQTLQLSMVVKMVFNAMLTAALVLVSEGNVPYSRDKGGSCTAPPRGFPRTDRKSVV